MLKCIYFFVGGWSTCVQMFLLEFLWTVSTSFISITGSGLYSDVNVYFGHLMVLTVMFIVSKYLTCTVLEMEVGNQRESLSSAIWLMVIQLWCSVWAPISPALQCSLMWEEDYRSVLWHLLEEWNHCQHITLPVPVALILLIHYYICKRKDI